METLWQCKDISMACMSCCYGSVKISMITMIKTVFKIVETQFKNC